MSEKKLGTVLTEPLDPESMARLKSFAQVTMIKSDWKLETWLNHVKEADAIINRKATVTEEIIDAAPKLRIIARTGVGADITRVNVQAATRRRVWVTVNPGVNADSVGELTLALILSLARKIPAADGAVRHGRWEARGQLVGIELTGRVMGIIGLGQIGGRVARIARALRMNVLAYDPYVSEKTAKRFGAELIDLKTLLKQADIITVHAPLTNETQGLLGLSELHMMKRDAFLVNTARGAIIEERSLYRVLAEGRIAGAGLDVFETEPPSRNNPLLKLANVVLTPHIGGATREANRRGSRAAVNEVLRVLQGKKPRNPVNSL